MDANAIPAPPKAIGPLTRLLIGIAGVDENTLRQCPAADWDNVKAVATIMICTWLYQAALFALIGHKLFASPGALRPDLLAAAAFVATFILLIDSYMVMRSGWYANGIEELKRGGLDISGGSSARLKAGIFLSIRILLSVGLAQLTAIFLSLLICGADISGQLHASYLQTNSELLSQARGLVDRDIARATEAADTEAARYANMAGQVAAVRQNQIDPAAGDTQVQQAQREFNGLLAEKAKAGEAVSAAETFAANELGGIRGAPENSGRPGDGSRHKAALERVAEARARAATVNGEVNAARARLDAVHKQRETAGLSIKQQSKEELPGFERALGDEEAKLTVAKDRLAALTANRDEAIRTAIEGSPDYVPIDSGLLAQIKALERVVENDPNIKIMIVLIDFVSFGFELAAVLAKVLAYCPTTYSALLASQGYLRTVRIVGELISKLDFEPADEEDIQPSDLAAADRDPAEGADDGPSPFGQPARADPFRPAADSVQPPKRPRGRPRKVALN